ncbi:TPA: thioredoxin-dependent thiol peroxidase [Candidatus Woesearchaeota archaeon]|nr:thioredoxin-dependent thiol peroxidase [Candidatus Woesearchaeota archaeon]
MTELTIGSKAPLFTLPNRDNDPISLEKALQGNWLVLYFYPKDDTPGCTIEAQDFTKLYSEFVKQKAPVFGISPDSPKSHCKFFEKQKLNHITLLSDEKHTVLEQYNVWGKKKFMGREYLSVLRTTFLLNPQGKIAWIWRDVNVKDHAADVLAKVKELQRM